MYVSLNMNHSSIFVLFAGVANQEIHQHSNNNVLKNILKFNK